MCVGSARVPADHNGGIWKGVCGARISNPFLKRCRWSTRLREEWAKGGDDVWRKEE